MKRKDTAIQQQVANLQMKIVQEDKAVENRTTDLLSDWEKTKPVAVREIKSSVHYDNIICFILFYTFYWLRILISSFFDFIFWITCIKKDRFEIGFTV